MKIMLKLRRIILLHIQLQMIELKWLPINMFLIKKFTSGLQVKIEALVRNLSKSKVWTVKLKKPLKSLPLLPLTSLYHLSYDSQAMMLN